MKHSMHLLSQEQTESLLGRLKAEGFPLVGVVDIDRCTDLLNEHHQRYQSWVESEFHGAMEYLRRGLERRRSPRNLLPEAESVWCVALPYSSKLPGTPNGKEGVQYARYLRGKDYHLEIPERIKRAVDAWLDEHRLELKSKICTDTSAILERSWAYFCGLGWLGKNTLLIHPQWGSYFLIGVLLLEAKTGRPPKPHPNYCGSCERCLTACPTQALIQPGRLDSRKCISYWTLEKRGELDLLPEQLTAIGNRVAGCDICQEACPFNLKVSKNELNTADPASVTHRAISTFAFSELLQEDALNYKSRIQRSALDRIKPDQFKRNLRIAILNSIKS